MRTCYVEGYEIRLCFWTENVDTLLMQAHVAQPATAFLSHLEDLQRPGQAADLVLEREDDRVDRVLVGARGPGAAWRSGRHPRTRAQVGEAEAGGPRGPGGAVSRHALAPHLVLRTMIPMKQRNSTRFLTDLRLFRPSILITTAKRPSRVQPTNCATTA